MTHLQLVNEITTQDRRDSVRKGYNRYALGIMLGAAQECTAEIEAGKRPEDAFAEHFTPTRGNHGIARRLGLKLDVQRGQWIKLAE